MLLDEAHGFSHAILGANKTTPTLGFPSRLQTAQIHAPTSLMKNVQPKRGEDHANQCARQGLRMGYGGKQHDAVFVMYLQWAGFGKSKR